MDITERSLVTFVVEGRTFWCWQRRQRQLHGANMNRESREGCHSAKGPGLHDFDIFFWSTKMATANFNKMEELWVEIDSRSSFLKAYVGSSHHPVTVSTSIIAFLVGSLYKPSFDTVIYVSFHLSWMIPDTPLRMPMTTGMIFIFSRGTLRTFGFSGESIKDSIWISLQPLPFCF